MLVISAAEVTEVTLEAPVVRLTPADLAEVRRRARVALRLAVIRIWEQDQSPLALNRTFAAR